VTFVIAQADGTLVEQGAAAQAEGLWWEYVTTVDCPGGEAKVLVTASDGSTSSPQASPATQPARRRRRA